MSLRDEIDAVVRSWDAHERHRGARAVVDYDVAPPTEEVEPAGSRLEVYERLTELHRKTVADGDEPTAAVVGAHLAYLTAVLGERWPLDLYVQATQGCPAAGWPDEYVTAAGERARAAAADLGVGWGPDTENQMRQLEGPIDIDEARERIQAVAAEVAPTVRELAGTSAAYTLAIEVVDIDDYWSYWLDGAGTAVRLRFNKRQAAFTDIRLQQFAQHEILGHALMSASFADADQRGQYDAVRALSVHLPYQVTSEGLACAVPLLIGATEPRLLARVRIDHYLQLVRAELHHAINDGATVAHCAEHARARVPWWTSDRIANELSDRGADPMLRSYLWSYPAGMDWFVNLADTGGPETVRKVLRAAYQRPLTPTDLAALWPDGPRVGGTGAPVRLRKSPVP